MKAGVFIGPQICQLFGDPQFDLILSDDKKAAWNAFRHVATGFLGNAKAVNFRKHVEDLITFYKKFGCNMSLKMHFFHSHLIPFSLTVVLYVMNMVSVFTWTSQRWITDTRANGLLPC
jgi:hypothetical protein